MVGRRGSGPSISPRCGGRSAALASTRVRGVLAGASNGNIALAHLVDHVPRLRPIFVLTLGRRQLGLTGEDEVLCQGGCVGGVWTNKEFGLFSSDLRTFFTTGASTSASAAFTSSIAAAMVLEMGSYVEDLVRIAGTAAVKCMAKKSGQG